MSNLLRSRMDLVLATSHNREVTRFRIALEGLLVILVLILLQQNCSQFAQNKSPSSSLDSVVSKFSVPPASSSCVSSQTTAGAVDFLNLDLKEYGWIFFDAMNEDCAPSAHWALRNKLSAILKLGPREDLGRNDILPYQGWLEGVHVEMIYMSALILGGRGLLTSELDGLVQKVRNQYQFNLDPDCDPHSVDNTCWDDQAQAVAAYAWIGAYEHLAGRSQTATFYTAKARELIHESLSPGNFLCIKQGSTELPVACSSISDLANRLEANQNHVLVFNHGFENLGYGIGLMTSYASAFLGLQLAESPYAPTAEEKAILKSIFKQGQRGATSDGSAYRSDACYAVQGNKLVGGQNCADLSYKPKMFPVRFMYESMGLVPNQDQYKYDLFDNSLFDPQQDFHHYGRKAIYGFATLYWWNPPGEPYQRPPLSSKVNLAYGNQVAHGVQIASYRLGQRCSETDMAFNVAPEDFGYAKLANQDLFTCWLPGIECPDQGQASGNGYIKVRKTWVPNRPSCEGSIDFGCGPCGDVILLGHGQQGRSDDNEACESGLVAYNVSIHPPYAKMDGPYFSCWNTGNECNPSQSYTVFNYQIQRRRCYVNPQTGKKTDYGCGDCPPPPSEP